MNGYLVFEVPLLLLRRLTGTTMMPLPQLCCQQLLPRQALLRSRFTSRTRRRSASWKLRVTSTSDE